MDTAKRTTLVVLFGGQSAEHDVSCVTAAHVMRAANPSKYRIVPVGIARDGRWVLPTSFKELTGGAEAIPERLTAEGDVASPAILSQDSGNTVVMPLIHGPLGEDGTVQGLLELLNIPYVGSGVLASAIGMDKAMAKKVFSAEGIAQANYYAFRDFEVTPQLLTQMENDLHFPIFVKPANMGSSVGVTKAHNREELDRAITVAAAYDEWIVCEEAINGREIEVSVIGNTAPRASVPGEIAPGHDFYDYEDKYVSNGAQLIIPANLPDDQAHMVRDLAIRAYNALRCEGMARVDFFFEENGRGFLCNEVNTIPGFTPISMYPKLWAASGLEYSALIDELIELAQERHSRRRRNTSH